VAFTGLVDVQKALDGYTPGAAWCCPSLRGRRHLSLGGGNSAGTFDESILTKIVSDLPLVVKANYSGVVFDVEQVSGSSDTMVAAFQYAFAAAKKLGLFVTVTTSHSAPYQTDKPTTAVELVRAWAKDSNIDVLSPQLYSSGSESAPQFDPTAACAAAGCTWDLYREAKPIIAPSIVDASQYSAVKSYFAAASIPTAGFIQWKQNAPHNARAVHTRTAADRTAANSSMTFGAYFANWAQYHTKPYTHTPEDLAPIAGKVDAFYYGFIYFCPPAGTNPMPYWAVAPYGQCTDATEFQLMSVEAKDPQFMQTITAYKSANPGLKVIASIGGWNFPSAYFSTMAATSDSRAKFIASAQAFLAANNLDGIDLDWEYPCSPARSDPVKISCTQFRSVDDKGGSCPQDTENLAALSKELRAALPATYISIASQASPENWAKMNLPGVTPFIDHWHVMTYDYTVSDVPDGSMMSPNAPLHAPPQPALQISIADTIEGYLAAGVPASKIMLGIPYYGHTWFQPGMTDWMGFGANGTVQGKCCGPFQKTFGAKPGKGSGLCGTMMYNELRAAGGSYYHDSATASDVAYFPSPGGDAYTEAGTWVSYNDQKSIAAITDYAKSKALAGVFVFDTSMDTIDFSSGTFTYELTNQIAEALGPAPGPAPSGCPGGSLEACMSACPATPLAAYKACVADCTKRCS